MFNIFFPFITYMLLKNWGRKKLGFNMNKLSAIQLFLNNKIILSLTKSNFS